MRFILQAKWSSFHDIKSLSNTGRCSNIYVLSCWAEANVIGIFYLDTQLNKIQTNITVNMRLISEQKEYISKQRFALKYFKITHLLRIFWTKQMDVINYFNAHRRRRCILQQEHTVDTHSCLFFPVSIAYVFVLQIKHTLDQSIRADVFSNIKHYISQFTQKVASIIYLSASSL